jgi:transposase
MSRTADRSKGSRPPYDPVMMFIVLMRQTLYTLSDEQTEYQLKGRMSFMRFCRLSAARRGAPMPRRSGFIASGWLQRERRAPFFTV